MHEACRQLLQTFIDLAAGDAESPLRGCLVQDVTAADGRISPVHATGPGETYTAILARHGLAELTADGASARRRDLDAEPGIFAAKFAEVEVDPDLGLVRVTRLVAAVGGGRILNEKTATSQIIGGTTGGIGMAPLEETVSDPGTGRIANATLGDYLVAVNADVPDIDVIFVGEPDPMNPIGVKGHRPKWPSWASRRPSPTPSSTPPDDAYGLCPSPPSNFCDRRQSQVPIAQGYGRGSSHDIQAEPAGSGTMSDGASRGRTLTEPAT